MKTKQLTFSLTEEQYEILKFCGSATGETPDEFAFRVGICNLFAAYDEFMAQPVAPVAASSTASN